MPSDATPHAIAGPKDRAARPGRSPRRGVRRVRLALVLGAALTAAACAGAPSADELGSTDSPSASSTRPTAPATTAEPGTTVPETTTTTEPPTTSSTEAPTTTTVVTTTAPPTTEPPTTAPPAAPPSAGEPPAVGQGIPPRLAAPGPLTLPGAPIVLGEGNWKPIGGSVGGSPGLYATYLRAGGGTPRAVGVAWIDPGAVRFQLHPGSEDPGGSFATPPVVPDQYRSVLAAAFNGGFKLREARGGFLLDGREAVALKNGAASLVIDSNGVATVGQWGRDVGPSSGLSGVRQNLELIVDHGQVRPDISPTDISVWGPTLGRAVYVARSGIGVRADGSLIYAGGPSLNAREIAEVLAAAGCVRAMELDINPSWVMFTWFNADAPSPHKLHPDMGPDENRFLHTDTRDFVAVYRRPG